VVSETLKSELLEERHSIRVLLLLRDAGPIARTPFYSMVAKGMTTAMQRVDLLIKEGLIEEEVMNKKPFAKNIRLSEKGVAVVKHLSAVEDLSPSFNGRVVAIFLVFIDDLFS
jgi:DNA-binding HxlR family transcriptional regulator